MPLFLVGDFSIGEIDHRRHFPARAGHSCVKELDRGIYPARGDITSAANSTPLHVGWSHASSLDVQFLWVSRLHPRLTFPCHLKA
jgi:hypothetical protein